MEEEEEEDTLELAGPFLKVNCQYPYLLSFYGNIYNW